MSDDATLLRRFVHEGRESDFAQLVERHVGMVFATALRRVGEDAHLAQDVTQSVFIDLARKAPALVHHRVLAAWLHTSTVYAAGKAVRSEQRRRRREEHAHAMQETHHESIADTDWARVRPVLDDALQALSTRDRNAILLRFFHAQGFAAVGASLHVSENAARMRVERALEKLRAQLGRRGIASTLAALGTALSAHAAAIPPATLAATVTTSALAGATGAGVTVTLFNLLAMTKTQIALTAAVATVGVATIAVELRDQTELRTTIAEATALADESANLQQEINTLEQTIRNTESARTLAAELAGTRRATHELQEQRSQLNARLNAAKPPPSSGPTTAPTSTPPAQLDEMPRTITRVPPVYPFGLKKAGIPGEVVVAFTVDAEGKVQAPVVVETTHPDFSAPALEAVQRWRFAPGKKGGRVVNARLHAPIVFEVQDPNWF